MRNGVDLLRKLGLFGHFAIVPHINKFEDSISYSTGLLTMGEQSFIYERPLRTRKIIMAMRPFGYLVY